MADNFCGIYVHGYEKPFKLQDNLEALLPFREFSASLHPLYIFFAIEGEISDACNLLKNVIPIQIPVMNSIHDYDEFMMHRCFHLIEEENTLTFHNDGWLLKSGWEEYAINFDYIGASWKRHIKNFDSHYKNNSVFAKFTGYEKLHTDTTVGNGGFCFRKKSKMLEVERSVDWSTRDNGECLPDDVFYSFWGFAQNIFKPVSVEEANVWSEEPYKFGKAFGFHKK